MTEPNSGTGGIYGLVMDYIVSSRPIATHIHAIALFILYYVFIRHYRAAKNESLKSHKQMKVSSLSTPNICASVRYNTIPIQDDRDKSVRQSLSTRTQSERKDSELEEALSKLEDDPSLQKGSTPEERQRFFLSSGGNTQATIRSLNHYLRWNKLYVGTKRDNGIRILPTPDGDYDLWVESCLTAMKLCGEVENIVLPRIVRMPPTHANATPNAKHDNFVDRDGHRAFCIRPGLMDLRLARGSTYTLAVAIYIDGCCARDELERVTVCLDVRAGRGWPNTHVLRLIPFIKESLKILLPLFPERLHKALVYPVPPAFLFVWKMMSKYLDKDTVDKVCIIEGRCKIEAPPPDDKLRAHFGEKELQQLETCRVETFKF